MDRIEQELEALLAHWEPERAADVEHSAAEILVRYGRELADEQHGDAVRHWRVVLAAGGVVSKSAADPAIAVIHRPRYDDWSLPKGKLVAGETLSQAARREVREETGCAVEIRRFAGLIHYLVKSGPKFVFYWDMHATRIEPLGPSDEVDRVEWLSIRTACDRLTHPLERDLLRRLA